MSSGATAELRLGIIGMSEGNGHPYSWSAIINGYDPAAMAQCPFPAIPAYLARESFPQAALGGARVTHVWTQDPLVSQDIAQASLIPNVVEHLEQMIGHVDAVLLARDDADNHEQHAAPFLRAGLPIYIDKPLSLTRHAALRLFAAARYPHQIFTCTALRYASELQMTPARRRRVGRVRFVDAIVPKHWPTYAVHVIEPVLQQFAEGDRVASHRRIVDADVTQLTVTWESGLQTRFTSTGAAAAPIAVSVHGERGTLRLVFRDSFAAFKAALAAFLTGIRSERTQISQQATLQVVELIEMGTGPAAE